MQRDNLTNQQRKLMSEIKDYDILLSILEKMIVEKLRKLEYGSLTIFIQDGVPHRTKIEVSEMITPDSFNNK